MNKSTHSSLSLRARPSESKTSWGKVANWYNNLLEKEEGTYQKQLILPNLLRLLQIKKGETVLDLACGQGFFAREFSKAGAKVTGVDISKELIELAKKYDDQSIEYHVAPADDLSFLKNKTIDKVTLILALQNIENVHGVLKESNRVLKDHGKLFIILNHPAFRIPKESSWGWDGEKKIQYRRIDSYLSESKVKIQMHPGENPKEKTISFHRPLQFYFKMLNKYGFCVSRLEEWNSNKTSEPGPRAQTEDRARKEIPIFLFIKSVI
jgi:ubiquinone/menaquinone biosynthesis C-methylase UbiE